MDRTQRAELYGALAEVFSNPPEWLALSGSEWPLYSLASELATSSTLGRQIFESIRDIPAEPVAVRQERYDALFSGPGRPKFWLHESLYRSGKLFGSETMEVERIYGAAGLEIDGAELADHASLELAFLAYVANQQVISDQQGETWREIEYKFIKTHAGAWLPALGRDLASSGDEVYAPIGQLLANWFVASRQPPQSRQFSTARLYTPVLQKSENCSLCGFCVQVCPRHVLIMHENAEETVLLHSKISCNGCGKCIRICPLQILTLGKLNNGGEPSGEMEVLRSSPRCHCPRCGRPTISQAEMNSIVGKIGPLPWLEFCQECRFSSKVNLT